MTQKETMHITMGLEVHVNMTACRQKLFSRACNGADPENPNSHLDYVDVGMPGALPVLNPDAVVHAVRTCLALNMKVNEVFTFDRKSYFYPDLPLGYQITQFYKPIGLNGFLSIYSDNLKRDIRIKQIHMETDAGKSLHEKDYTLLDYNRAGSPLLEIVTEPDFHSAEEVIYFIRMLRAILKYIQVSDASMELGNFRVDLNISISNTSILGTRTEIKNLNSFKSIRKAIEYEYERHAKILARGEKVRQETRSFDDKTGQTAFMRTKEAADDYTYFQEPDLPEFMLDDDFILSQRPYITNLPTTLLDNLDKKFGLKANGLNLVEEQYISNFIHKALDKEPLENQKQMLKLMFGEIFARIKEDLTIPISYVNFQKLARLVREKELNSVLIKEIMDEMWAEDADPYQIIKSKNLEQIDDLKVIQKYIEEVFTQNPKEVERYVKGETKLRAFFVGQVMKKTQNKVKASLLNQVLDEELLKLG